MDLRGARPGPRPGLVGRTGPCAGRFAGARDLDRARGPLRAGDHRRARGGAAAPGRDRGRGRHCAGADVRTVRVGLVGTGLIAQVMHLHYLAELADRFDVAAVCDLDRESARACAERYGIPAVFTDWRELLGHPLDAVMVLTSGSHAPIAEAAARSGRHVFVEKPMCFSAAEGQAMVAAAGQAGVVMMVGYPKRYDPAFARFAEEAGQLAGAARAGRARLLRVTTLESP